MTEPQPTVTEEKGTSSVWDRLRRVPTEPVALALVTLGFVLRVREAWGTFLNPDEALHFFIANRASFDAAYRASLTMAHPPLLIFLLYGLRPFGNSELLLRLPAILTGSLFCWIFFKWLSRILGPAAGLVGLVFAALLPPLISVTAQVRQYGLLLLFLIAGAWFLERALEENSPGLMLISAVSLWLAMLSHYSAFLFITVIGIYAILRFWRCRPSVSTVIAWIAGQGIALALALFLYLTHISTIKGTTMAEQAFDGWLRKSYFHRGHENPLTFLITRSFSLFQYIFGQLIIGDIVALLFVAGIVLLLRKKVQTSRGRPELVAIFVFPFLLNYSAALLDLYPYGGTRHCVYLAIFAIAAVAAGILKIAGQNTVRGITISAFIVALCFMFRTNHAPYIARADENRANMDHAVSFIREKIPQSDPIFADYETGIELGHYLCEQRPVTYDGSIPGFLVFNCGRHRIISTITDVWAFSPSVFLNQWANLVRSEQLKLGETVWVVQAGWMVKLDEDLRKEFPEFHDLRTQKYGNNIRFFQLIAGQAMPTASGSPETKTAEHP
jgi:Dolichyl-phosphate-mannose-protein mannosyltransferase